MVIRGGENVYPREIEEFLYTHPSVADVQVVGVPDERYGEELMAWVVLRPGAEWSEDEISEFCRGTDRPFQDPALRQVRRLLPDDGDRQGAEVQDARDRHRGARPRRGRRDRDGLSLPRPARARAARAAPDPLEDVVGRVLLLLARRVLDEVELERLAVAGRSPGELQPLPVAHLM